MITIKTKTMPKAKTNKKDTDKDIDTYIDKETERMIDIDLDKNKALLVRDICPHGYGTLT